MNRNIGNKKNFVANHPEIIVEDIEDLDLNDVLEIFREQGVMKKEKNQ